MTSLNRPCGKCKGKGFMYVKDWFDPDDVVPEDCEFCDGTGVIETGIINGDGSFARLAAADMCVRCHTFLDGEKECPTCRLVFGERDVKN